MNSMTTDHKENQNPNPCLYEDLIYEILLRLPVKSLLQFRTVCKSWLSIISSSYFVKTHLSMSTNDPHYTHHRLISCEWISCRYFRKHTEPWTGSVYSLLNESNTQFVDERLDKKNILSNEFRESRIRRSRSMSDDEPISDWQADLYYEGDIKVKGVVGYCNGLVCLNCSNKSVYLWNPATKKARKLPDLEPRNIIDEYDTDNRRHGFCYDELNDAFKVYAVVYGYNGYEVSVYSSKSNCWKEIKDFPSGGVSSRHRVIFANGALYWVLFNWVPVKGSDDYEKSYIIISLDINTEMYREICLRPNYTKGEGKYCWILGVFGKSLSMLCNFGTHVDLWVLKRCGMQEFWTKLFTIPYMDTQLNHYWFLEPICVSGNGDIMLQFKSTILLHNSKYNTFKELVELNFVKECKWNRKFNLEPDVYTYVESLVSP